MIPENDTELIEELFDQFLCVGLTPTQAFACLPYSIFPAISYSQLPDCSTSESDPLSQFLSP